MLHETCGRLRARSIGLTHSMPHVRGLTSAQTNPKFLVG
jgi:hypothetical protein